MLRLLVTILITSWLVGCTAATTDSAARRAALKPNVMMLGLSY